MSPSTLTAVPAGTLVAIGGAEDKLGRSTVLRRFVDQAGGSGARIAVCASASSIPQEVLGLYRTVFTDLGAGEVVDVTPHSREESDDSGRAREIAGADAIFLSGGNQIKLGQAIVGTAVGDAIVSAHRGGRTVGGTSAGASIMSEHMVAFGTAGATPRHRIAHLGRGLGLLPGVVVDQHFRQRNRFGRLLALVAETPSLLGVGLDEDTAAVVVGGRVLEVVGRGSVFVCDAGHATSNAATASRTQPLLLSGVVVHTLPAGARFDLSRRCLVDEVEGTHPAEASDLAATAAQAREVARRHRPRAE